MNSKSTSPQTPHVLLPHILSLVCLCLTTISTSAYAYAHALPWNEFIPPDDRYVVVANRHSYNFAESVGLKQIYYHNIGVREPGYVYDFFIASAQLDVRCFLWSSELVQGRVDGEGEDGEGKDEGLRFISPICRRGDRLRATEEELELGLGIGKARYNTFACYDVSQPYDTAVVAIEAAYGDPVRKDLLIVQVPLDEAGAGELEKVWPDEIPLVNLMVLESTAGPGTSCKIYAGGGGVGDEGRPASHDGAARVGEPIGGFRLPRDVAGYWPFEYRIRCVSEKGEPIS